MEDENKPEEEENHPTHNAEDQPNTEEQPAAEVTPPAEPVVEDNNPETWQDKPVEEPLANASAEKFKEVSNNYDNKGFYQKYVVSPLDSFSNINFFRKGFNNVFTIAAIGIALYSVYLAIWMLLGDDGYFAEIKQQEVFPMIRSIVASLVTVTLSTLTIMVIVGIFWKRSNDFKDSEEEHLSLYLPKLFRLMGEIFAVFPAAMALYTFTAVLLVANPYMPLQELFYGFAEYFDQIPFIAEYFSEGLGTYQEGLGIDGFGDYLDVFFNVGILGIVWGFVTSFLMLFAFYIAAEIISIAIKFFLKRAKA
jgi:hypothetical protein